MWSEVGVCGVTPSRNRDKRTREREGVGCDCDGGIVMPGLVQWLLHRHPLADLPFSPDQFSRITNEYCGACVRVVSCNVKAPFLTKDERVE